MLPMRSIEIDIDVHKAIEAKRRSFEEPPNEILRRLLGIAHAEGLQQNDQRKPQGRSWSGKGVELPEGTRVRMSYNGTSHEGEVRDGKWFIDGKKFASPSAAANGVAVTREGEKTQLNGWIYWEVLMPGATRWKQISSLRKR